MNHSNAIIFGIIGGKAIHVTMGNTLIVSSESDVTWIKEGFKIKEELFTVGDFVTINSLISHQIVRIERFFQNADTKRREFTGTCFFKASSVPINYNGEEFEVLATDVYKNCSPNEVTGRVVVKNWSSLTKGTQPGPDAVYVRSRYLHEVRRTESWNIHDHHSVPEVSLSPEIQESILPQHEGEIFQKDLSPDVVAKVPAQHQEEKSRKQNKTKGENTIKEEKSSKGKATSKKGQDKKRAPKKESKSKKESSSKRGAEDPAKNKTPVSKKAKNSEPIEVDSDEDDLPIWINDPVSSTKNRNTYDRVKRGNKIFQLYDTICLKGEAQEEFLGIITELFQDKRGRQLKGLPQMEISWFYRNSDLVHCPTSNDDQELYLSQHRDVNPVDSLSRPIRVLNKNNIPNFAEWRQQEPDAFYFSYMLNEAKTNLIPTALEAEKAIIYLLDDLNNPYLTRFETVGAVAKESILINTSDTLPQRFEFNFDLEEQELNPEEQVRAHPYSNGQPFLLEVSAAAQFLIDLHAHLYNREIIGYLTGEWDPKDRVVRVTNAFPVKASESSRTSVEMDPVHSVEVRNRIEQEFKTQVVGWYHSHPNFTPDPSLRDVENHWKNQQMWGDQPFIGAIVTPWDTHLPSYHSAQLWYHAVGEAMTSLPLPTVKQLLYYVAPLTQHSDDLAKRMKEVMEEVDTSSRGAMKLTTQWETGILKVEKMKQALLHRAPHQDMSILSQIK
eukprot:TRINITY_DN12522_c0_g1_i1.p1 TRINITY_DN12522_c0_g1~~TRINITY_DN12522_c0_g1_i1.p1  ORF type:complete len:725 (-),score=166.28 TRINITY_DN12522_c0_g1_i1:62-2236(-)